MKGTRNIVDPRTELADLRTSLIEIVSSFEYEVDGHCGLTNPDLPAIKHSIWDKAYAASSAIIELYCTISDLMYVLRPLCPEEEQQYD